MNSSSLFALCVFALLNLVLVQAIVPTGERCRCKSTNPIRRCAIDSKRDPNWCDVRLCGPKYFCDNDGTEWCQKVRVKSKFVCDNSEEKAPEAATRCRCIKKVIDEVHVVRTTVWATPGIAFLTPTIYEVARKIISQDIKFACRTLYLMYTYFHLWHQTTNTLKNNLVSLISFYRRSELLFFFFLNNTSPVKI